MERKKIGQSQGDQDVDIEQTSIIAMVLDEDIEQNQDVENGAVGILDPTRPDALQKFR